MKINYGKTIILNYIYILFIELMFKFFVMKTFDIGIMYIAIFSLFIAVVFSCLTSLFKKAKINKIIYIMGIVLFASIMTAETVYYSFYRTICGLEALSYGGQVMDFASAIKDHIISNILIILAILVPTILLIVLVIKDKIINDRLLKKETLLLLFGTVMLVFTSLLYNKNIQNSSYKLLLKSNNLMESTNRFGIVSSIVSDTYKLIVGFEEKIVVEETNNEELVEIIEEKKTEYNMLDIEFKESNDSTINDMNKYFEKEIPTEKNDYTGIFKGKNLIFIVAEGFYPIAVNEELTPTLYKMANNSFVFDNFYQPIYNCSTSDGEFINDLSLLPGVSTCSMKSTVNTYLPYSLGNIMDNYNYNTYAFHGWTYTYYNRDKAYPNLGYEYYGYDRYKKGYKNALKGIKDSWPTSDVDVINASYDIYSKDDNFVAYYMSISGHLQYNFGNAMSKRNKDAVKDLDASTTIKAYIASQIELDKSLELLLNNLERDGKLDDTVIVITPDHYPYGLSNKEIMNYDKSVKNTNFDLYKNTLIVYNSGIETQHVKKYTSSLDVLPTILNMFGVEYDSRLLIGNDIMSSASDLVIFNNKSWITDKGRYNYLTKVFEPFDNNEVDQTYIDKINNIVDLKFKMSKLIISKDYYRKVLGD